MRDSIAHADHSFGELVDAGGGNGRVPRGPRRDPGGRPRADRGRARALPLADALGADWRVLAPNAERPERAELAVSPTARAAAVYVLAEARRRERIHAGVRDRLRELDGVDLVEPDLDARRTAPAAARRSWSSATAPSFASGRARR